MKALVLAALFCVIDIASKALAGQLLRRRVRRISVADRLERIRLYRLAGSSWWEAFQCSALPVLAGGAALTEGKHTGEFLVSEANGTLSRDKATVTVAATTTLPAGLVLGRITATGKYVPYDNGAVDGSEVASAVLYGELRNEGVAPADFIGTIINFGAEVRLADLEWNGQLQAAIDAGVVDLALRFIKAR